MTNITETASETENLALEEEEEDLHLTIKPITARRMKLLEDFRIERDEDYRELGEMFSEDE